MIASSPQSTTIQRPKLSQVLFEERDHSFASIASFRSNIGAVDNSLLFSNGLHAFLTLVGPSGWGKTHLLEAIAINMGREHGYRPQLYSAVEWVMQGARADGPGVLLLDNVQDALEGGRMRQQLRYALERRVRGGRPTALAFTANRPTRQLRSYLPESRAWLIAPVPAPEASERFMVVDQMARSENLRLDKRLAKVISARINGNGLTFAGAMKRLRLNGAEWTSDAQILHACGILDPFFSDSNWDFIDKVIRAAEAPELRKAKINQRELAISVLMDVAEMPESKVAGYFGLPPGEVFGIVGRQRELSETRPELAGIHSTFLSQIVSVIQD